MGTSNGGEDGPLLPLVPDIFSRLRLRAADFDRFGCIPYVQYTSQLSGWETTTPHSTAVTATRKKHGNRRLIRFHSGGQYACLHRLGKRAASCLVVDVQLKNLGRPISHGSNTCSATIEHGNRIDQACVTPKGPSSDEAEVRLYTTLR
jgi:hypothetical protein